MSVSVVIPTYDVALCVERAIRSALDQSHQPAEVIVVDDASTDSTCDVVSRLSREDGRIKLLRQPVNRGPAAARNVGLKSAAGDWIAILDADDAFLPDHLRYLVAAGESRGLDFAADNVIYYDAAAQRVSRLGIEPARIGACLELDRYTFVRHCMMNQPGCIDLAGLKPIMRRSFLMSHGLLYPEDSRHGEDFIFYFRAIMAGAKFSLFPEPGYLYSERFGTISRQRSDMSRTTVDYRLMERRALELASDATVRNDPMLASLLVARAGRIRALYRARELRASLKSRDLLDLALQFVRHADARAFLSNAVRRKLMRPTHRMR